MVLKQILKKWYLKQQFQPSLLGVFCSPFFIARYGLYKELKEDCKQLKGKVLDIGCGSKPYEDLCGAQEYVGLEFDSEANKKNTKADFFYDGKKFPFASESFENIICNQVLEHVFNPNDFLCEIRRVLKPSGKVLLTVPFVWDEHEQPADYARYTSFGLTYLLSQNGFKILHIKKINPGLSTLLQLKLGWFYKILVKLFPPKAVMGLTAITFFLPNFLYLLLFCKKGSHSDLYLDNLVLMEKN